MTDLIDTSKPAKRVRRMAREPKQAAEMHAIAEPAVANAIKTSSKANQVLQLLMRPEGATIAQMVTATGWLPHTTRAALTGLKKKGHVVTSEKITGEERVYRAAAAE
ncbi:DUF3489 domain-containing protein [Alteraurantiacibacter buctensis]|uniref:DUF3489 domain-containing protein n=1 Tax=Alteraurantiacibacter buctensis TaxID=1503981 RepID=A0A844YTU7_9SPHN|nr:DUF3489 domain-containing protein [Alteraurantiacibacter buctensis]MXO70291.1 DUF3489 domain-containing protein [Alteraurantiacibacter buctensis]